MEFRDFMYLQILKLNSSDHETAHALHGDRVRCVIVEDHCMFVQLLECVLSRESRLQVVGVANSVMEGINICRAHSPDLLILDLNLANEDGIEVARFMKQHRPDSRTLILSGQADAFRCPPDLRGHIEAVVGKNETFALLCQEISGIIHKFHGKGSNTKNPNAKKLTRREKEIFELIGKGMSTKEIAGACHISPHTVEAHRKNIARKVGTSASSLIALASVYHLIKRVSK